MVSHGPYANGPPQKIQEAPSTGLSKIPQPKVVRQPASRPSSGPRACSAERANVGGAHSQGLASQEATMLEAPSRLQMPQAAQPP
eukprot:3139496-Amphidinium_carterae.1